MKSQSETATIAMRKYKGSKRFLMSTGTNQERDRAGYTVRAVIILAKSIAGAYARKARLDVLKTQRQEITVAKSRGIMAAHADVECSAINSDGTIDISGKAVKLDDQYLELMIGESREYREAYLNTVASLSHI